MIQSNHSAQDFQPTFIDLVESYKQSSRYLALSEGSKREYKKPLERLLEMGSKLVIENTMQMPVAVARSRSHSVYWLKRIVEADVTDYEKGRLVLFLKLVYRSMDLGHMVEGLRLPTDMRHERGEAHPLTKEKVDRVWAVQESALRTYVVFIAFCFYTGMRPSEARALKWEDVGDEFLTVMGSKRRQKGVPTRMIPVLPEIRRCLDYCKKLGSKWVFVSANRRPLDKDVTCQKVREIYGLCGIKGELYDARRGVATEMIRKGYALIDVANLLGHKDTRTTEKYLRLTMEEKARTYKGV